MVKRPCPPSVFDVIGTRHRAAPSSGDNKYTELVLDTAHYTIPSYFSDDYPKDIYGTQHPKVAGCAGVWDNITCWRSAEIGETVTVPCPKIFSNFFSEQGNISKNCTNKGWSEMFPHFFVACGLKDIEDNPVFYVWLKAIYTLGHSVSLIALVAGSIILCVFRKLHCTRNYIHLNLFLSFILKAVSVFVKDGILFYDTSTDKCSDHVSWVGCKASLVFFQYCVMANFYWLLVEGLYLHILLMIMFSSNRHFTAYLLTGWGIPTIFIIIWIITRVYLENSGCWDTNEHSAPWWIIRVPILISILSTLLLIPLFGVHYVVFALFGVSEYYQMIFELCLGSFQGLVVAILYCFLNSEVRGELKRKWKSWCLNERMSRDYKVHRSSVFPNDSESGPQLHRNSATQFSSQTETSVI
ncbi:Vasoactive intestinal polypeptide receptor 2, partial [Ophiophagus hannah]